MLNDGTRGGLKAPGPGSRPITLPKAPVGTPRAGRVGGPICYDVFALHGFARRATPGVAPVAVIQTINVTKVFDTGGAGVNAVRGIDLRVDPGELLAIVGPSGSGKSTLLSLIGAIDQPTSGKVLLDGVDLATLSDDERTLIRRRRIGFIFQAFNLLPTLSALENAALPLELEGVSGRERASGLWTCWKTSAWPRVPITSPA